MNITIKNLKTAGGDETLRFSASVYLNGKKVAIVANGGTGGGHQYDFFRGDRQQFYAYVDRLKTNPLDLNDPLHRTIADFIQDFQQTIVNFSQSDIDSDIVIDCAIELQQFQKQCKTKTLFRFATDRRNVLRTISSPFDARIKAYLVKKYGRDIVIINELISIAPGV